MNKDNEDSLLKPFYQTPCMDEEVYNNLPNSLQNICGHFKEHSRERDVVLISTIVMISGLLPKLCGTYARKRLFANLFLFIAAPAASFKGSMSWCRELGAKIHRDMITKYNLALTEYNARKLERKNGTDDGTEELEPPKQTMLFVPANNSSAAMINSLTDNDGAGIIFESEADTLSQTFKSEWGAYGHVLRCVFHHEPVTSKRVAGKAYQEIERPRISLLVSGTIAQIKRLIPSVEDGLFSRFIFYSYMLPPFWMDVSPDGGLNIEDEFNEYSKHYDKIYQHFNIKELSFELQKHHWEEINKSFAEYLITESELTSTETRSAMVRLGPICFRIAMILTAIRSFETQAKSDILVCNDTDFRTAIRITEVLREHSLTTFNHLMGESNSNFANHAQKELFYAKLPDVFQRKVAATEISKEVSISVRTADAYLQQFKMDGRLKRVSNGVYAKVHRTNSE